MNSGSKAETIYVSLSFLEYRQKPVRSHGRITVRQKVKRNWNKKQRRKIKALSRSSSSTDAGKEYMPSDNDDDFDAGDQFGGKFGDKIGAQIFDRIGDHQISWLIWWQV